MTTAKVLEGNVPCHPAEGSKYLRSNGSASRSQSHITPLIISPPMLCSTESPKTPSLTPGPVRYLVVVPPPAAVPTPSPVAAFKPTFLYPPQPICFEEGSGIPVVVAKVPVAAACDYDIEPRGGDESGCWSRANAEHVQSPLAAHWPTPHLRSPHPGYQSFSQSFNVGGAEVGHSLNSRPTQHSHTSYREKYFDIEEKKLKTLERIYLRHESPSGSGLKQVAERLGLSYKQVTLWFQWKRSEKRKRGDSRHQAGPLFVTTLPLAQPEQQPPRQQRSQECFIDTTRSRPSIMSIDAICG
ncbi:hypothetical protein BDR26DRAFT_853284 [Obelidium mucronatum]|nr:hypothetical protein BDR26DRAFT_853284 [Obelidium mucronatum]